MVLNFNLEGLDNIALDVRRVAYDDVVGLVLRDGVEHVAEQEDAAAVDSVEACVAYRGVEGFLGDVGHRDDCSRYLRCDGHAYGSATRAEIEDLRVLKILSVDDLEDLFDEHFCVEARDQHGRVHAERKSHEFLEPDYVLERHAFYPGIYPLLVLCEVVVLHELSCSCDELGAAEARRVGHDHPRFVLAV